ncbi:MAG: response regulator transcription factor [Acidobacteriia bacterium]|nr:response regulator transcription factor [Terriglobia bacterium]
MPRIRALLVDDHALFRESVARVLAAEADLDVSHCATIQDALRLLQHQPVDLVLLDHDLGNERAFQFLPAARQIGFAGRVLIVTAWISDTAARRLIRQGVAGIFSKQSPLSALAEAIRGVQAGQTYLDPRYEALAGDESATGPQGSGPRFNDRQRRVLRFVLEGLSNKEIAWRLQISESYVKAILQTLFEKTGVRTRGQLVRVALEQYEDQL